MTTYYNFAPSTAAPYQFQPVLDGQTYNATVPWLLFGRRYYLNLSAVDGTPIWYGAVVGSPTGFSIVDLVWANGRVTATTLVPHGLRIASTVSLNVSGCAPDTYNGLIEAYITGPSSFSYAIATDPGAASVFGSASQDINLIGGVPNISDVAFTSRLVFRQASQQFEVW
jgi:hypothetical protein